MTYTEEAIEKGYVVRPFLQGRFEQCQGALDAGSVLAVRLVVGWRIL